MVVAALAAGCATRSAARATLSPSLARDLDALAATLGRVDGSLPTLLRYRVEAPDGAWLHEIVFSDGRYAEQRRRVDGAGRYALGEDERGAWLRIGDDPPVAANAAWTAEIRGRRALFTGGYLTPQRGDEAVRLSHWRTGWEYSYRAAGGRTLTLEIARRSGLPVSFDTLDAHSRIVRCGALEWTDFEDARVVARARCRVGGGQEMPAWDARVTLLRAAQIDDADALPSFGSAACAFLGCPRLAAT